MEATARIVAVSDAGRDDPGPARERRRTRLATVRSQAPLLLRRTGPADDGDGVQVHLVGGAAGPLGGDRLRLEVEVGPGASLCLRTVAASLALPGPDGAASQVEVIATVAAGGRLEWLPEPLIAASGCHHLASCRVTLAEDAHLTWRDELVCGRYGEPPGDAVVALAVTYAGRPLYQHELAVGPGAPGWDGAAVLGQAARATGSLLRVDPGWAAGPPDPVVLGPTAAMLPLAGPAVLTTATGPDAAAVRRHLDAATDQPADQPAEADRRCATAEGDPGRSRPAP